jgi:NDP-sugar pyrophosphorylase family protein
MKVLIPMSGQGKRFVEAGYKDPKPLILVDGVPMIKHVMDLFPGETDIHCICNKDHLQTTNMRSILEGLGARIHEIDNHSLGPVYAVSHIMDQLADDEEVLVSYCDYGTVWDYQRFLGTVRDPSVDGAIATYKGFHPHMLGTDNYAFLRCDESGNLLEIREKEPFTQNRMEEHASNGTYYFKRAADLKKYFQEVLQSGSKWQKNGEFYVSLVYNLMVRDGKRVIPFEIQKMLQWGTPKDLETYTMWSDHFKGQSVPKLKAKSSATLLLPLAGRGSRFSMKGYTDPKPLLDVNGKPMIVRAVESIPDCEKKVFVCLEEHLQTYPLKETLQEAFGDHVSVFGIPETTEGQACTCEIGIQKAGISSETPILISACDNGVDYDEEAYFKLEQDSSIDVIVWSFTNNPTSTLYPHMYAWLDVSEEGDIRHVSVKKHVEGAKHAIIGTMFFRRSALFLEGLQTIYEKNIRTNGEFYVDDLLNPLIEAGYKVKVFPADRYICWGTPNDYKTYQYWLDYFNVDQRISSQ